MRKFSLYSIFKSILLKNNRIYLTLFFVVACIVTLVIYSNRWSSNIEISKIIVRGNKLLSKNEILSTLDNSVYQLKNKNIQLLKIKSDVKTNPYVLKAFVMRKNLSEIIIDIVERTPMSILVDVTGELYFVDKNAVVLPYRILPYLRDLPILRNVVNKKSINTKAIKGAIEFLNEMNKQANSSLTKYISDIKYNTNNKNYTCVSFNNNFCKILLGEAVNIQEKVELLTSFWYNKLTNVDMLQIQYIDLRWKDRVVVKFIA